MSSSVTARVQGAANATEDDRDVPIRGRVLVVDDDPLLRTLLARVLRGHEVELVTSAFAALERIADGARFDAIVSDISMPGMTGLELHEALLRFAPDQARRMVLMSGSPVPGGHDRPRVPFFAKPFDVQQLSGVVSRLCARAR
jgi:CheY-like chemotaxis protein